jgi:hypothetical protein
MDPHVLPGLKDEAPMTKVVSKTIPIIEPIGAFYFSTINSEVIH